MSWISLTPEATSDWASVTRSAIGRDWCFPVMMGMAQYEQLRLQPSEIFI